ncbi:MAG TPA: hypothetical protein VL175_12385 [Pirellulales bacterium]|jgi:hypothetical protein|nr:hypothetical protein [Pirellulales bacterium]
MRRAGCVCILAIWAVLPAGPCLAQLGEHERLALTVAPYVDMQTLVIAHFDLAVIDAPRTVTMLARLMRLSEQEHARLQGEFAPLEVLHGALPEGGSADVFIVVSLADINPAQIASRGGNPAPNGAQPGANRENARKAAGLPFFVVVSLDRKSPASPIALEVRRAVAIANKVEVTSEKIGNAVIVASPSTIERLKKAQPTVRAELSSAFEAAGEGAAHILFVPSAEARFAAETLLPTVPPGLGGGPTKIWTQGAQWVAVGLDLPPAPSAVRIVVQSTSEQAAAALARQLNVVTDALGKRADIRKAFPKIDEIGKRLEPKISGNRLALETDEKSGGFEDLSSYLAAVLLSARRAANAAD